MRIYEVTYNLDGPGRMGDGLDIFRTRDQREAERFAAGKSCYSGPATVAETDVPARIARRWGS